MGVCFQSNNRGSLPKTKSFVIAFTEWLDETSINSSQHTDIRSLSFSNIYVPRAILDGENRTRWNDERDGQWEIAQRTERLQSIDRFWNWRGPKDLLSIFIHYSYECVCCYRCCCCCSYVFLVPHISASIETISNSWASGEEKTKENTGPGVEGTQQQQQQHKQHTPSNFREKEHMKNRMSHSSKHCRNDSASAYVLWSPAPENIKRSFGK